MAFGDALRSSTLHDVPPNCPSQLSKCALTLQKIQSGDGFPLVIGTECDLL